MKLFFDTESTGLMNDAAMLQVAAVLCDDDLSEVGAFHCIINQAITAIPADAARIHGITLPIMQRYGIRLRSAVSMFYSMSIMAKDIVAHNIQFDDRIMGHAFDIIGVSDRPWRQADKRRLCTMKLATPACKLPNPKYPGDYKWPTLDEAIKHFNIQRIGKAHNALSDVRACIEVYRHLEAGGYIHAQTP